MGYGTESSLFGIVAAVLGIVLILTVVLRMWKKVPQDKAGVVTGMKKRVITGGGGLVIPVFERIDYISLGNIPLSVATRSSLSSQGVPISVITTAVIKVRNEKNSILTAIEQFTGRNEKEIIDNIQGTAIAVLEGKLREIIATMTVEELYQKREEFSSRVQEVVGTELGNMGLEVKNFTITDISDENGYIKALGDGMIAQRKKDAEIQKAEAARDMQIKTSQARQEGESAKLKAEADIAQAAKDKAVLEANYMQEPLPASLSHLSCGCCLGCCYAGLVVAVSFFHSFLNGFDNFLSFLRCGTFRNPHSQIGYFCRMTLFLLKVFYDRQAFDNQHAKCADDCSVWQVVPGEA